MSLSAAPVLPEVVERFRDPTRFGSMLLFQDAALSCLFCFFSISLFFLHLLLALRLRSLRFLPPRWCRVAVFLIQTNVSLAYLEVYRTVPNTSMMWDHGTQLGTSNFPPAYAAEKS